MGDTFLEKLKKNRDKSTPTIDTGAISAEEIDTLLSSALDGTAPVTETEDVKEEPEVVVEAVAPVVQTTVTTKKHTAFNSYWDEKQKKFMLITLEYDPVTHESRVTEVRPIADNYSVALYMLNKMLSLKLVRGEERL